MDDKKPIAGDVVMALIDRTNDPDDMNGVLMVDGPRGDSEFAVWFYGYGVDGMPGVVAGIRYSVHGQWMFFDGKHEYHQQTMAEAVNSLAEHEAYADLFQTMN